MLQPWLLNLLKESFMFSGDVLETIKVILEIMGLVFLPLVAYALRSVIIHGRKLEMLEEKVNSEINRRLEVMERKIDTFDNKIESKIDKLENNLNAKIDMMTSILTSFTNNYDSKKGK